MQNITVREVLVHPNFLWSNSKKTVKNCFIKIIEQETDNKSVDIKLLCYVVDKLSRIYKKTKNKKRVLNSAEYEDFLDTKLLPEVSEDLNHLEELLLSSPDETDTSTVELEEVATPVTTIPTVASLADLTPVRPKQKSFHNLSRSQKYKLTKIW